MIYYEILIYLKKTNCLKFKNYTIIKVLPFNVKPNISNHLSRKTIFS